MLEGESVARGILAQQEAARQLHYQKLLFRLEGFLTNEIGGEVGSAEQALTDLHTGNIRGVIGYLSEEIDRIEAQQKKADETERAELERKRGNYMRWKVSLSQSR